MGSIGRGRDFCLGCCQEAGAEAQLASFCLLIKRMKLTSNFYVLLRLRVLELHLCASIHLAGMMLKAELTFIL
jgi:hypothetical protein